ncbi:MFS transporter [Roseateles saccharophilus]|uniref:Putative MFS family arabinose efflux permease n=1 Tax=Roseateles saccharophilus TaxID=304 RepID=A0A4R3VFZ2_ROSSA|nr:MFS transporter [Roseateles saccharophilus]MDG0831225.1 MFS transporter [Roseateles saccharophilus]TCV04346.1 putative MFS family arabinose efflux permease [Roseateles saccharophilus]
MNRKLALLVLVQGLFLTNNICFMAINGLVGLALAPRPWMATLPICAYVAGGALMARLVGRHQLRFGRRRAFQIGLSVALLSCAIALWSVLNGQFWGVVAATLVAGYYNANAALYRFAATELVAPEKREAAISWVLAGGCLGAILGPLLARESRNLLVAPFAGAYLLLMGVAVAGLLLISLIDFPALARPAPGAGGRPSAELARQPVFLVALAASALGYGVMNLLMAATPIAMGQCGLPFADASRVLQWHVLGMFVPSFFTGPLIRRVGVLPVMAAGVLLNLGCVAFALSGQDLEHFLGALLLLGVGWNFLYIGGTTLFTQAYRPEEKTRAQGLLDTGVYATMTLTSFSSGALVTGGGWQWMNWASLVPIGLCAAALAGLAVQPRKGG